MKAVFVGDAHLQGRKDPNQSNFCDFLDNLKDIDHLFIMGDLFEYWVGYNRFIHHHYKPVIDGLIGLAHRGVKIIYMEGNHDFSLEPFFAATIGADVYPDTADIRYDGKRLLLSHGDVIDEKRSYVFLRAFLRSRPFRIFHRLVPPMVGWKIAIESARRSRAAMERGVVLERTLRQYAREKIGEGFDLVVMGHTHLAALFHEEVNGQSGTYANSGDWITDHSYLVYRDGVLSIENFQAAQ